MSISPEQMSQLEDIRSRLHRALEKFLIKDCELIQRDASERSITHKIAEYLQREFPEYHVDCEYNRRGDEVKRIREQIGNLSCQPDQTDAVTVFPDIIVHKRGIRSDNLLVIEAKKSNGASDTKDREKLRYFTASDEYRYSFGVLLKIDVDDSSVTADTWFYDGREIHE